MATDAKFKVGDRVRVVLGTALLQVGSEHTVIRVDTRRGIDVSGMGANWPYEPGRFELIAPALSPGRALTEDGSVRVNEEQAGALKKPIIYFDSTNCGLLAAPKVSRTWDADKYNGAANWIPLDQRIAAAKAELSKPAPPRFPAEGRQDRALSVTNGMIRGRE